MKKEIELELGEVPEKTEESQNQVTIQKEPNFSGSIFDLFR